LIFEVLESEFIIALGLEFFGFEVIVVTPRFPEQRNNNIFDQSKSQTEHYTSLQKLLNRK